ncbi:hypothetical protein VSR34_00340 [Paraburkholderia sp. JHI2823]|uniref:hypothetical protein n=1 Tax=Paraburkholderia sp. JHI2823 TaxID=3112960 RepID=UPI00317F3965
MRGAEPELLPCPSLQRGFLLVDPGALESDAPLTALAASTCTPVNWGSDLTGLPMVIDLERCEPVHREWLTSKLVAEQGQREHFPLARQAICGHLTASTSLADVAAHIARQILVLPVDRRGYRSGVAALWRIFDPRVFANLCWMLDAGDHHTLLGPVSCWSFPWFGHWYTVERTWPWRPEHAASDISPTSPTPVEISVWERAQSIAQINLVLGRLGLPNDLVWAQRVSIARRIESALETARRRLHWHRADDLLPYAEHVIRYGEAFANHPGLTAYWRSREAREASGGWAEAARLLTDDDYEMLERQQPALDGNGRHPHQPPSTF